MLKSNKLPMKLNMVVVICGLLFACHASADEARKSTGNGEIQVFGSIVEQPCSVLNQEIDVDFNTMTNKDLFYGNDEKRKFQIELECDEGVNDTITVQFNSSNTSENNQLLNLSPSSQASGVGIKIQDNLGKILTFGNPTENINIQSGLNNLEFTAFVTIKADTLSLNDIGLGTFDATATFELRYE